MSDEHEDDDLPPERVTLFSVIDNKEGANLIKSIYFFLGGYCALIIIGVVALFYFTGRINGIFAVVVAFWIFNRLDQYKLGRRSDIKFEIIFFTGFPVALFLILTYATLGSGGPVVDDYGNMIGVAVSKLDQKQIMENYDVSPELSNFAIRASAVRNLMEGNNIQIKKALSKEISNMERTKQIKDATIHLTCWMTKAQIEKVLESDTGKVLFKKFMK